MKCDYLMWDVFKFTQGLFSLGWNWGWGYYRALQAMKKAGWGGLLQDYPHGQSDVVIMTDPIHIGVNKYIKPDYINKIKKQKKKLVLLSYESLVDNDEPVPSGTKSYLPILDKSPTWQALMAFADLYVVADPRDQFYIANDKTRGWPKTVHMPLAVDETMFVPQPKRIDKACFIGSRWISNRKTTLATIPGRLIDYPSANWKGNTYEARRLATQNYVQVCGKYAINLNVRTIFAGLQVRIFETMALGRVCVSHKPLDVPGRTDHYKALQNVVWYDNAKQITPTLDSLIKDPKRLATVGQAARAEVVAKHTHTHRIKKILECL